MIQLLIWILFLTVKEINFLIYSVFDCVGYGLLILWFSPIDFDVDVVGFQLFDFTDLVKPYYTTKIIAILCLLNCIFEIVQLTKGRKCFPRGPHIGQSCSTVYPMNLAVLRIHYCFTICVVESANYRCLTFMRMLMKDSDKLSPIMRVWANRRVG
jgi:hypothetical protein